MLKREDEAMKAFEEAMDVFLSAGETGREDAYRIRGKISETRRKGNII